MPAVALLACNDHDMLWGPELVPRGGLDTELISHLQWSPFFHFVVFWYIGCEFFVDIIDCHWVVWVVSGQDLVDLNPVVVFIREDRYDLVAGYDGSDVFSNGQEVWSSAGMSHGDLYIPSYQVSNCHHLEVLRDLFLFQHVVYSILHVYTIGSVSGQNGRTDLYYQALGVCHLLLGVRALFCRARFGW